MKTIIAKLKVQIITAQLLVFLGSFAFAQNQADPNLKMNLNSRSVTEASGICKECEDRGNSKNQMDLASIANKAGSVTALAQEVLAGDIRATHPEYNAIGRVEVPIVGQLISHGTGTMINECLMLTNRHVVEGATGPVKFKVGYTGNANSPFSHEVEGEVVGMGLNGKSGYGTGEDWAIVKLNKSVGKKIEEGGVGALSAKFATVETIQNCPKIELAAFPWGKAEDTITHHQDCTFKAGGGGSLIFNSCKTTAGESGGP